MYTIYMYMYCRCELLCQNMVTSLRAVGELQNPAIRDRHQETLVPATKVGVVNNMGVVCCHSQVVMSEETNLAGLLALTDTTYKMR